MKSIEQELKMSDEPVLGMAYRYIGERDKADLAHKIHYFAGKDPTSNPSSWIFVADLPGCGRHVHWHGFPQDYERWPEHDKIVPQPPQILIHGMTVDKIVQGLIETTHEQSNATLNSLFDQSMYLTCELAKEMTKRGIKNVPITITNNTAGTISVCDTERK